MGAELVKYLGGVAGKLTAQYLASIWLVTPLDQGLALALAELPEEIACLFGK